MLLFELMLGVILMLVCVAMAGLIVALIIASIDEALMDDIKKATSNKLRRWIFGKDKDG